MKFSKIIFLFAALLVSISSRAQTNEQRTLVLIIGAAGEPEYGEDFSAWADLWKQAAAKGGLQTSVIGEDTNNPENDLTQLLTVLTNEVAKPAGEFWIVFIGDGTYDGHFGRIQPARPGYFGDRFGGGFEAMPASACSD